MSGAAQRSGGVILRNRTFTQFPVTVLVSKRSCTVFDVPTFLWIAKQYFHDCIFV